MEGFFTDLRRVFTKHYLFCAVASLLSVFLFWFPGLAIAASWRFLDHLHWKTTLYITYCFIPFCILLIGYLLYRLYQTVKSFDWRAGLVYAFFTITCSLSVFFASSFIAPLVDLRDDLSGKVRHYGPITAESFRTIKNDIEGRRFKPKTLLISSGGGRLSAAMAIGKLIQKHKLDVDVEMICGSACANFIFPAGKNKSLSQDAIIMYHGNYLQKKWIRYFDALITANGDHSRVPDDIHPGIHGKEVTFSIPDDFEDSQKHENALIATPEWVGSVDHNQEILSYLEFPARFTLAEEKNIYVALEQGFYKNLGIDQKIGVYGQLGDYFDTYQRYEFDGFYYTPDDMKRMGIDNIRIKGGEWRPQENPDFDKYYLVSLPDDYLNSNVSPNDNDALGEHAEQ